MIIIIIIIYCWATLQNSDVPANTNSSAAHISYINPKLCTVKKMLILNFILLIRQTFIFAFIPRSWFWPPSSTLRFFSFSSLPVCRLIAH